MRARHRIRSRLLLTAGGVVGALLLVRGFDRDAPGERPSAPEQAAAERSRPPPAVVGRSDRGPADRTDPRGRVASGARGAGEAFAAGRRADPLAAAREPSDPLSKSSAIPIVLDELFVPAEMPAVTISGFDPLAPRELAAWRIEGGRSAVVAWGESDHDGSLHFPQVIAPGGGLAVVVTAADSMPGLPGESEVRRLGARLPAAPQARHLATVGGETFVRIVPSEASGRVLLADSFGTVIARHEVPPSPAAAARVFDVALTVFGGEQSLLLAHEFRDGRRSDWRELRLPEPSEEARSE